MVDQGRARMVFLRAMAAPMVQGLRMRMQRLVQRAPQERVNTQVRAEVVAEVCAIQREAFPPAMVERVGLQEERVAAAEA